MRYHIIYVGQPVETGGCQADSQTADLHKPVTAAVSWDFEALKNLFGRSDIQTYRQPESQTIFSPLFQGTKYVDQSWWWWQRWPWPYRQVRSADVSLYHIRSDQLIVISHQVGSADVNMWCHVYNSKYKGTGDHEQRSCCVRMCAWSSLHCSWAHTKCSQCGPTMANWLINQRHY